MDDTTFIQQQNEVRRDFQNENVYSKRRWTIRSLLCQVTILGWTLVCFFSLVIPFLTYYLVVDLGTYKRIETFTCFVNGTFRVPCGGVNVTENRCVDSGCCFDATRKKCYHYLPSKYSYDLEGLEYRASRPLSPFLTKTVPTMRLTINEKTVDTVSVFLHRENDLIEGNFLSRKNYLVDKIEEKLMVEIFRSKSKKLLLTTTKGPLIASENYWEWTVYLSNGNLFGIDRTLIEIKENSTFTRVFYKNRNDHFSEPVIWAYSENSFHGLIVRHEGPLELSILPSNLIILKSLTGGTVELELSIGPTPKDLYKQQAQNSFPDILTFPYWALQTYVCRNQGNYWNVSSLVENSNIDETAESFCVDENLLMAIMVQTKNGNYSGDALGELLDKYGNKKFLLHVPPQILEDSDLYKKAEELGVFYRYNGTIYRGKYLGQNVSYPDWSHGNISEFIEMFDGFIGENINGTVDGFILSGNWPHNEKFEMDNVTFPYFTEDFQNAMSHTIRWNATANNIPHIQNHNNYGPSQYEAFKTYYQPKTPQPIIMSATKSLDRQQPTMADNVETSWTNLRKSISNMLFASITGNQFVSLPVCGDGNFDGNLQEKLCLRWYLVAATMPLFGTSSGPPYRSPKDLPTKFAQQAAADAVNLRNMLLPFYFTIINNNEPLIRPMFYDFYGNTETFSMSEQYMIGDKILVGHPLTADRTKLTIYLPPEIGVWYEFWSGKAFETNETQSWASLSVRETDFLAFIAQGTIIPLKVDNNINLIIAMDGKPKAKGEMKLDDISMNFNANITGIEINIESNVMEWNITLGYIKVYNNLNNTDLLPSRKDINADIVEKSSYFPYVDPSTTESTTTEQTSTSTVYEMF